MDTGATVRSAVLEIAQRNKPQLLEVHDQQSLRDELGLVSLDIAELVARLELELKIDPFSTSTTLRSIRTVGELCRAYQSGAT